MIRIGDKAANFTLKGIFQGTVSDFTLQSFPGKWLILFFYPADFTFICPTEVAGFSKMAHQFRAEDAEIFGVSVDSLESHRKWGEELGGVNYPLLSDEGKTVSRLYDGVCLRGTLAAGSYLSSSTEKDIFDKELRDAEVLAEKEPYLAAEGLLKALNQEGLARQQSYNIVKVLLRQEHAFLRTFQEKSSASDRRKLTGPFKAH